MNTLLSADALNANQIIAQNIAAKFDEENEDHGDGSDSEGEEEADIQHQTKGRLEMVDVI